MDSLPSVDLKVRLGKIQGKVETIIEDAVKNKRKIDMLNKNEGALQLQKVLI